MIDSNQTPVVNPEEDWFGPTWNNTIAVYALYLLGFVVGGIPTIVGVVFAYINRGKGDLALDSHYTYQIRTFWIGLLYTCISALLAVVLIGFLLLIAVVIWFIIRCIKGIQAANARQPIANPNSWLI